MKRTLVFLSILIAASVLSACASGPVGPTETPFPPLFTRIPTFTIQPTNTSTSIPTQTPEPTTTPWPVASIVLAKGESVSLFRVVDGAWANFENTGDDTIIGCFARIKITSNLPYGNVICAFSCRDSYLNPATKINVVSLPGHKLEVEYSTNWEVK